MRVNYGNQLINELPLNHGNKTTNSHFLKKTSDTHKKIQNKKHLWWFQNYRWFWIFVNLRHRDINEKNWHNVWFYFFSWQRQTLNGEYYNISYNMLKMFFFLNNIVGKRFMFLRQQTSIWLSLRYPWHNATCSVMTDVCW